MLIVDNPGGWNISDPLDMLTISQVADILQKDKVTIREYLKRYNIPYVKRKEGWKRPRKIYIMRKDLEKFILGQWDNGK